MRDRLAGATALAALLLGASVSQAQQPYVVGGSGQPAVYVNTQVLNSLTPGFAPGSPYAPYNYGAYGYQQQAPSPYQQPYGQQAYGQPAQGQPPATIGGYYITRPGTLLFPPQQFPQSQLTVSPQQLASLQPSQAQAAPSQFGGSVQLTPPSAAGTAPVAPPALGDTPSSEPSLSAPAAAASSPATTAASTDAPSIPAPSVPAPSAPTPESSVADVSASEGQVPAIPPPSLAAAEPPEPPAPPAETQVAAATTEPPAPAPEPPAPELPAAEDASAETAPPPPEPAAEDSSATLAPPPPSLPPEPAPPAQADATSETQSGETQTAALTTGTPELSDDSKRLIFAEGTADLDEAAKQVLRDVANGLKADQNARVQLLAYASSDDDSASRARRLSLSRALAVRQFLIKEGVRSTRMDVRALGNKFEGGPADRVDVLPARR